MTSLHWDHQKKFVLFFILEELQYKFKNHVRYPLQKVFQKHQSRKIVLQKDYFESPNKEYVNTFDALLFHCYMTYQITKHNVQHYLILSLKVRESRMIVK